MFPPILHFRRCRTRKKYYKEYRKKQTAESRLSDFIKAANDEAAYLDSVTDALSRAQTDPEITEIKNELVQTGFLKRRPDQKSKKYKAASPNGV